MATLPTAASSWPDMLAGVICKSKRVVAAHPYHFLALSILFLLPLSSLVVAAPSLTTFSPHSLPPPQSLLRHSFPFPSAADATLALSLAYAMAALLVALSAATAVSSSVSAATAVSSSVRRSFFGRPVKLLPALRSLPAPLARLLLTLFAINHLQQLSNFQNNNHLQQLSNFQNNVSCESQWRDKDDRRDKGDNSHNNPDINGENMGDETSSIATNSNTSGSFAN